MTRCAGECTSSKGFTKTTCMRALPHSLHSLMRMMQRYRLPRLTKNSIKFTFLTQILSSSFHRRHRSKGSKYMLTSSRLAKMVSHYLRWMILLCKTTLNRMLSGLTPKIKITRLDSGIHSIGVSLGMADVTGKS